MFNKLKSKISLNPFAKFMLGLILFIAVAKYLPVPSKLVGICICLFLLLGYYKLIISCLEFCKPDFMKYLRKDWLKLLLLSILSIIFVYTEIYLSDTIYVWDATQMWAPAVISIDLLNDEPYKALKILRESINYWDYTRLIPMMIVPMMNIIGISFASYCICILIMFALPAAIILSLMIKVILEKYIDQENSLAFIMALVLMIPMYEMPILAGYANVSIMLTGSLMLFMLLNLDEKQLQLKQLTMICALMILSVFQARTGAYMVIGCLAGYAAYVIYRNFDGFRSTQPIKLLFKKYCYMCIASAGFLLIFFKHFIFHAITFDAKTVYVAYALKLSIFDRIFSHFLSIGTLLYAIFVIGIIIGLYKKAFRQYTIFALTWTIISISLFCRIQIMYWQHHYIMLIPFIVVIVFTIIFCLKKFKRVGIILSFLLSLNFLQSYSGILPTPDGAFYPPHIRNDNPKSGMNNSESHLPHIHHDLSDFKIPTGCIYVPQVRHDLEDYKNLITDLRQMTKEKDELVCFMVCSGLYNNATVLQISKAPSICHDVPRLTYADVDVRDGFYTEFFDADVVVTATPIQFHMHPKDQQITLILNEVMENNTPISRHFELIKEYVLNPDKPSSEIKIGELGNITFKVYRKRTPYEKSDIDFLENLFEKSYSTYPKLFRNRFEKYKEEHFN